MTGLTAREIMTANLITIAPEASVTEAAHILVEKGIGALPVVSEGVLVGLVTEGDLIMQDVKLEFPTYIHLLDGFIMYPPATARFEHELKKAVAAHVSDVMTTKPITVQASATVEDVATLLVDRDISRVPVLDGDVLVGLITKADIVRGIFGGTRS